MSVTKKTMEIVEARLQSACRAIALTYSTDEESDEYREAFMAAKYELFEQLKTGFFVEFFE
jgi:hypothetical protein